MLITPMQITVTMTEYFLNKNSEKVLRKTFEDVHVSKLRLKQIFYESANKNDKI